MRKTLEVINELKKEGLVSPGPNEKSPDLKVMIQDGRILTLQELYAEYEKTHAAQAELAFKEKIRILVDLQRLAFSWGKKADVIVWKI